MTYQPIWRDYFCEVDAESLSFQILTGGKIIYNGVAHRRPNHSTLQVKLNDICADYLFNELPTMSQSAFDALSFPLVFEIEDAITGEPLDEVAFVNDWSYEYDRDILADGMAAPVNGKILPTQWLTFTGLDMDEVTAVITLQDGTEMRVMMPLRISEDFSNDFNNDFARSVRSAGSGTAVIDLSRWEGVRKVVVNGVEYKAVDSCARYVLYYINAYGGWDSFVIEGNTTMSENVTRIERETGYDNRDMKNRGKVNVASQMERVMTMHTSWLSDEQSLRMHHLLNSTNVYLFDNETREMQPVLLSNDVTNFKTYKGSGNQMVNYTIELTFSNKKERR